MTGKRFYIDNDGDLYDRQTKRLLMLDFGYSEAIYVNAVLELLNALHEEKESLKTRFHEERELAMRLSRECDILTIKKQELELWNEKYTVMIKANSNLNEVLSDELEKVKKENQRLKSRITYLERKMDRERNATTKQHLKWSKEAEEQIQTLKEENEQLKLLIKKVLETTPIEHSLAIDLKNSIKELYK